MFAGDIIAPPLRILFSKQNKFSTVVEISVQN